MPELELEVGDDGEEVGVAGALAVPVGGALEVPDARPRRRRSCWPPRRRCRSGSGCRAAPASIAGSRVGQVVDRGGHHATAACRRWCRTARPPRRRRRARSAPPRRCTRGRAGSRRRSARSRRRPAGPRATRCATVSRTIARFSSPVVRSARSTCRMSDLATSADRRGLGVQQRPHLRVVGDRDAGLAGGAERDQHGVPQVQFGARAAEELGVLGHRARPAALDEADAELVEQPGDRELVDHRVADALALGAVAQRGVEDLERHQESFLERRNKKTSRGCGRSARSAEGRPAR